MQESRNSGGRPDDVTRKSSQTTTDYGTTAMPRSSSGKQSNETSLTDQAKQQASGVADQAQEQAGKLVDTAKQQASGVADQAQEQAGKLVDTAQQQAMSQAESQKTRLAQGIDSVADAVGQVGQQLRQNDQDHVAHYAETAVGELHQLSGYIRQQDVGQMVDDAQDLIRRRPALVLGGAFALGMLGARFLKSSGSSQSQSSTMNTRRYGRYDGTMRNRYPATRTGYNTPTVPAAGYDRDTMMHPPATNDRDTHRSSASTHAKDGA